MERNFRWFPLANATDNIDDGGGWCLIPAFFMVFVDIALLVVRLPLFYIAGYNV